MREKAKVIKELSVKHQFANTHFHIAPHQQSMPSYTRTVFRKRDEKTNEGLGECWTSHFKAQSLILFQTQKFFLEIVITGIMCQRPSINSFYLMDVMLLNVNIYWRRFETFWQIYNTRILSKTKLGTFIGLFLMIRDMFFFTFYGVKLHQRTQR